MQPGAGPGGPNPFGPGQNPFAYNVDTTYAPSDEVVPAVPQHPPQTAGFAANQGGAWGPPPGSAAPQHVTLQFTDTTAPQYVSGNIQRVEERQTLVAPGGRSDDPGSSSAHFAQPGVPGQPAAPSGPPPPTGAGGQNANKEDYTKYPFYNPRRYREWFDVDTTDVLWRVGNSMIGVFRPNFMEVTMKNPDLYGPFWAATTLIFVTAVAGNFSSYINFKMNRPAAAPPPPLTPDGQAVQPHHITDDQWFTDYTKLATSAAIFYGYIFIIGLLFFFVVKWFKGEIKLVNVFCIYGYCLTIFVPVSIACVVPIDWLRWTLVMVATALSAGFLFMNFRATIYSAAPAKATLVLLAIVACHIGLGLGLKLYFFQY